MVVWQKIKDKDMFEYLKRKLTRTKRLNLEIDTYPQYYKENGKFIKELANGEKWVVELDSDRKEILVERVK